MKALSLWQPHAQAIAMGLKEYETRDWATNYRGPLAIQAAKRRWDDWGAWHKEARARIEGRYALHGRVPMAYGAVICVVDLVDCIRTSALRGRISAEHEFWGDFTDGETGAGRYAFRLANVRVLPQPVAVRGVQGFFDVSVPGYEGGAVSKETLSLFGEAEPAGQVGEIEAMRAKGAWTC